MGNQSEQEFLKAVHVRYGPNPTVADLVNMKMEDFYVEDVGLYEWAFDLIKSLFDVQEVNDFVIILMNRLEKRAVI